MRSTADRLVRAGTVIWLATHFSLTVLYNLPLNPLKVQHLRLLNGTIGRYFPQNWSLFAPNPLATDDALLARCLSREETDARADGGELPTDGWYDLSTPYWRNHQRNRFSAYDRLIRPQTGAMRQYMTGGLPLAPYAESCQKGWTEACDFYKKGLARSRDVSGRMLGRIGSAFCRDTGSSTAFAAVALRMRETPANPWSKRYETNRTSRDIELGVYPIDSRVATTHLYRPTDMP